MSNSLTPKSFFSTFDISFFIPGMIVFLGIFTFVIAPLLELPIVDSKQAVKNQVIDVNQPARGAAGNAPPDSSSTSTLDSSTPTTTPSGKQPKVKTTPPAAANSVAPQNEDAASQTLNTSSSSHPKPSDEAFLRIRQLVKRLFAFSSTSVNLNSLIPLAVCLVFIYVLGLVTHAISWTIFHPLELRLNQSPFGWLWDLVKAWSATYITRALQPVKHWRLMAFLTKHWSVKLGQNNTKTSAPDAWNRDADYFVKFVDYFWYLRSTCWNSATAILIVMLLCYYLHGGFPLRLTLPALAVCLCLIHQGYVFGRSCRDTQKIVWGLTADSHSAVAPD